MSLLRLLAPALLVLAAGCGGDGVSVRGSLHPSLLGDGNGEGWSVWAEEAEREAPVKGGEFELAGLAPGPVHLQLRREGREVGRIAMATLGAGMGVGLEGLRVDESSRLAFPSRVDVEGASVVWVNGIRMGPAEAVPDSVDTRGAVLALQPGAGVVLFRPDDEALPDLRVVAGPRTSPLSVDDLAAGDSLRIAGRRAGDHVVVSLLEPAGVADEGTGGDFGDAGDGGDGLASVDDEPETAASASPAPVPSVASPPVRDRPAPAVVSRAPPAAGRDRDDRGKGRGRGNGKGKGGKKQD